jgi:hypothetical protein
MTRPPYDDARRVFWIVDNCSAHRGSRAVERLQTRYPRLVLVHAPVHASWLNQVEIYFSIVATQGPDTERLPRPEQLGRVATRFSILLGSNSRPFEWKFTRQDLMELMNKLGRAEAMAAA